VSRRAILIIRQQRHLGFAPRDRALQTFRAQIMKLYRHPLSATRIVPFVETPVGLSAAA